MTIKGRKGDTVVEEDEYIKHGVTIEGISKLRPAFGQGRHRDRRQRIGHQ